VLLFLLLGTLVPADGSPLISGLFSLPLVADATEIEPSESARRAPRAPTESFIAGPENVLLKPLSEAVLLPQVAFNPVVLYGPAGVGKTSLAHALASKRRQALHLRSVIATTGAELAQELAHAIVTKADEDLRSRYQRCDLLLVDEVDHLVDRNAAQQFLVSTLDALVTRGSLVIATVRCAVGGPLAIAGLQPALASRLSGGLVVRLSPPGLLARREIIKQAAARIDYPVNEQMIEKLAAEIQRPETLITASRLRQAVLQLASGTKPRNADSPDLKAAYRQITAAVAKHLGLTVTELKSKSRQQNIAEARGLAMHLVRRLTGASYAEIGRQFGGRDHTTVLHACRRVNSTAARDPASRRLIEELVAVLAADSLP